MKNRLSSLHLVPLILLSIATILITHCGEKQKTLPPIDEAFTGYITAFTGGIVSNQSPIKIQLSEDYPNANLDEAIQEDIFEFSPKLEGEAYWLDKRTIEFRPAGDLPSGKLFQTEFFLSKLMKVPANLETLVFQFQVMKQSLDVMFSGIEALDTENLKWQTLSGTVHSYDFADGESLESSIVALQNGEELTVQWEHSGDGKTHKFIVDSIQRSESASQVIVEWNGESLGFNEENEAAFEIPPLGEFKVVDVTINQQPEQFITVHFSDPINENQDLNGLLYLDPTMEVRIVKNTNSVRLYPSSRLLGSSKLFVTTGIQNILGYDLMEDYERPITFTSIKPKVELVGNGIILPSTNGLKFPFKAVNLNAVNVKILRVFEENVAQFLQVNQFDGTREMKRVGRIVFKGEVPLRSEKAIDYGNWNTFSIDLSELIKAEPGAIYRVHLSFDKAHSLYPCSDPGEENLIAQVIDDEKGFDSPSGYWSYYNDWNFNYDNYDYRERDNPCKPSYYMNQEHMVARNVFASNLGIIAKAGHGAKMVAAVADIRTTDPMSGVEVSIYNFQNKLINSGTTNDKGLLEIDLTKKPFLLVAKKDGQYGYLRLDDGMALSMSMFDVGGQKIQEGVKGYIYGERGVWRPGDSLFVSFVLEDKNLVLPKKHPVVFELYTPEQQLYDRKVSTNSVNGFYDFRTVTDQDAPTGNWLAKVKLGGSVFSKSLKIETVKPNRLKIKLDFEKDYLSDIGDQTGNLELKWLHGAIAKNLRADIALQFSRSSKAFEAYNDYVFDDPSKDFYSEENIIYEGYVNEKGLANVNPNINVQDNAPGMLNANFKIRAFEKGGDFSVDRFSMPYSPYRSYVGVKVPEGPGWNGALYSNEPNMIPIVTVDEQGKPVDKKGVKIEVYNIYWRWWWERSDENELARYVSNRQANLIHSATIDTKDGKALYEMNLNRRYWGRKFIKIIDPESGHSCGKTFYTTYKGWWSSPDGDNPGGAEMLTFTTDQTKYNMGDDIKVNIPSAKKGRVLVSVESGSQIIDTFWLNMSEGENEFSFKATEEMAPNVYVNLTLIQPHNNVENDLPIRLYGVQSIKVENPDSHLEPVINMPDVLAPEENFTVKVSESKGKSMTYTLAVVDDGLLDLTRFKTPNLWKHFNAKEALSVKTWDMYKYVMGALSGEMAGLLALGGDETAKVDGGAKANRFKPVVKFLGPYTLDANSSRSHTIQMPNYVGSVRTMVVAGQNSAYGSVDKTTPVKKPLMVLATMPRVVGPGEKLSLPITVFAMDKKVKDVSVKIEANEFLNNLSGSTQQISFTEEGDQVVNFDLSVAEKLGIAKVKVIAEGAGEKATYDIELDVRIPNPEITEVTKGAIEPGETWEMEYTPVGMTGTNEGMVELSRFPPMNLEGRLQYLIRYPHGCIEQTTSSVFPQLFVDNMLKLNEADKIEIQNNVTAGIARLKTFQISSGGLSYWPGYADEASDWGTNYAGHFMLEAQAMGYALPPGFLKNWIKFQKQRANSWTNDMERQGYGRGSNQLIQAYRLYTLALAKKPQLGAMNRMRSLNNLTVSAKWRLAAAYLLAGKKDIAEKMVNNLKTEVPYYTELAYSYGSSYRDRAMIMEVLCLMDRKQDAKTILDELAKEMSSARWYSTQTTAYTLLAASKFAGLTGGTGEEMKYNYVLNGSIPRNIEESRPFSQIDLGIKAAENGKISITNNGETVLFMAMNLSGIPLVGDPTDSESDLLMTVDYKSLDDLPIDVTQLEQGTDFIAEVKIKHPGLRGDYNEMALTQIFPSGWEIRNTRMDMTQSSLISEIPEYQDIRDDRVYSYFDIERGNSKTYRVILNAAYLGEYYLPTVYCEAMYDNEINARRGGKWVKVIEPGTDVN